MQRPAGRGRERQKQDPRCSGSQLEWRKGAAGRLTFWASSPALRLDLPARPPLLVALPFFTPFFETAATPFCTHPTQSTPHKTKAHTTHLTTIGHHAMKQSRGVCAKLLSVPWQKDICLPGCVARCIGMSESSQDAQRVCALVDSFLCRVVGGAGEERGGEGG